MKKEDMICLLKIYDAKDDLIRILKLLAGSDASDTALSFNDGIIGALENVVTVIDNNSPIYDPTEDYLSQPIYEALSDRSLPYEKRAGIILGED